MDNFEFEFELESDNGEYSISFEPSPDLFLDPNDEEDLKKLYELMDEFVEEENYEEAQRIKEKIENSKK